MFSGTADTNVTHLLQNFREEIKERTILFQNFLTTLHHPLEFPSIFPNYE